MRSPERQTRREMMRRGARTAGAALVGTALWGPSALAGLTSGCAGAAQAQPQRCGRTGADIEGPFYRPGAPARSDLREHRAGVPLLLEGRVMSGCRPLAGAEIDLWQADHSGAYDLAGFGLRARLRTDADGRYRIATLMPGHYLNGARYRPAHLHVKVRVQGVVRLTTQLYFEGDPYNADDAWFHPSRALHLVRRGDEALARFDFGV